MSTIFSHAPEGTTQSTMKHNNAKLSKKKIVSNFGREYSRPVFYTSHIYIIIDVNKNQMIVTELLRVLDTGIRLDYFFIRF